MTATWVQLQTPTSRHSVYVGDDLDPTAAGDAAAALREQYGFPADWPEEPDWDCVLRPDESHVTYWDSLFVVRQERDAMAGQVRQMAAEISALQDYIEQLKRGE